MTKRRRRNTRIPKNTGQYYKFLVLLSIISLGLILISSLTGCNSVTLDQNVKHYQSRVTQIMHVTRDQAFGSEYNTYSRLYRYWRKENALQRQQHYYQECLRNLASQKPEQIL